MPTKILVPENFGDLAKGNLAEYIVPSEVATYARLDDAQLTLLQAEPVILVAEAKPFAKLVAKNDGPPPGKFAGKALLITDEIDLEAVPFACQRGFDMAPPDTPAGTWCYKINKFLEEFRFDETIRDLRAADLKSRNELDSLNEIGVALSTEKELDALLELIVTKSREMTFADAGSLYLVETVPDSNDDPNDFLANKKMRFQVAQCDSRDNPFRSMLQDISKSTIAGYVVLTQEALNFDDVYHLEPDREYGWGGKDFDAVTNYRTKSMLTVPMVNWRGDSIGAIQLINRKTDGKIMLGEPEDAVGFITAFTDHDHRIALSIASQASIAIQNAQLVNSIKGLFDGFIAASVKAIESRDPTTSGHSQRVAALTVELAKLVDADQGTKFKHFQFDEEMLQEIRYASLLHDFGKIGVRENVLVKAKKLFPHEVEAVRSRFDLIRRTVDLEDAEKRLQKLAQLKNLDEVKELAEKALQERDDRMKQVEEYLEFIMQCNEPTVLAQGGFEHLNDIHATTFKNWDGTEVRFINEKELVSLSVPKGSLNDNDRKEIESHVTHTYRFLSTIPWTPDLRNVPDIAYAHHEKLDGTGYPAKLNASQIPVQSKMMTISDIFDALTAMDRPYKKALPAERALNILFEETGANHVDADLLQIFVDSEIYKIVL